MGHVPPYGVHKRCMHSPKLANMVHSSLSKWSWEDVDCHFVMKGEFKSYQYGVAYCDESEFMTEPRVRLPPQDKREAVRLINNIIGRYKLSIRHPWNTLTIIKGRPPLPHRSSFVMIVPSKGSVEMNWLGNTEIVHRNCMVSRIPRSSMTIHS